MFVLDGKPLSPDRAFTDVNGIQRPANWLRLASPEERADAGITEELDPPGWDQRFYWGYDASGALIPKDHGQLVEQWSAQTRQTANSLLNASDWLVIREKDNGALVPIDWKVYRENVRLTCGNRVVMIKGTATTDELAAVITQDFGGIFPWPRDPEQSSAASDAPSSAGDEGGSSDGATLSAASPDPTLADDGSTGGATD